MHPLDVPTTALTAPPQRVHALHGLIDLLNGAGTVLIVLLAVLVNSDVIGRAAFNTPLHGVPEIAGLAIVAIVFLQIPYCLRGGHLTRSDAFLTKLFGSAPRVAVALDAAYALCGFAVFALITWAGWRFTVKAWTGDEYEGAAGVFTIPVWPVKLAIVIGAALMAVMYLRTAWLDVRAIARRDYRDVGSFGGGEL